LKHKKNKTFAKGDSQIRFCKTRAINENVSENQKDFSGSFVTRSNQYYEYNAIVGSDRRIIEQSHKGIFACPHFFDFFRNEDDTRLK
jgi:hypothetical protein